MPKIAIMTDSNSGITQQEGKELGIKVIPMPFNIDGEEYLEDINLTQEQFYQKLTSGAKVSTSQPSSIYVESIWDELLQEYDQVVYIPMSSGLSKSCETATNSAKAKYEGKVFVVDNQRISVTQRQSVIDALELAKCGYDGQAIYDKLMEIKFDSDIFIMVDTLEYLKKGGRITAAAAALGGMLKLKPILLIKGEKLDNFRMRNRSIETAKEIMLDACLEKVNGYLKDKDGRTDNIYYEVAYSGVDKTDVLDFIKIIKEKVGENADIFCAPLSLSISCHIGPGALAMAVCKKMPDEWTK